MENQNPQNQQTPQPQYQQTVIVVGKQKSVGVAFLLAFLFGPLGLLYASVVGGIVMFLLGIVIGIFTFGFGLIFVWPVCIIWAIVAANNANKKFASGGGININTNFGNPTSQQPPTTQKVNPQPQVQPQFAQTETEQPKTDIGETASKSINAFGDWATQNKKGLLIGGGSILGLVVLIVLVKFLLSIDFKKDNTTQEQITQTQTNEQPTSQNNSSASTNNQPTLIENQFIVDTYLGTIGNKDFKLFIEKVEGENVEGYNVTGTNRRPVKGRIVNKWKQGDYTTVFKLILNEPGNDKWDGEFNIDLFISDQGRSGEGTWKSFNGKLEHDIKIRDRLNE